MEYKSNKPYPVLEVEGKNIYYAKLLLSNYSGKVSEDTAIHLYLYQAFLLEGEYQKTMLKIAEVEMYHLRLLGEVITKLGGVPIFGDYQKDNVLRLWSSCNVNYSVSLKEMLEQDILSETKAIENYKKQIKLIDDCYVKSLLRRIIEDELVHLSIFKNLYQKVCIDS
jgi:bacterioferritin